MQRIFSWDHAGVGKSTLLNKMFSDLNLRTGEVSQFTSKGIHTTVTAYMIKLQTVIPSIIDTPWELERIDLME